MSDVLNKEIEEAWENGEDYISIKVYKKGKSGKGALFTAVGGYEEVIGPALNALNAKRVSDIGNGKQDGLMSEISDIISNAEKDPDQVKRIIDGVIGNDNKIGTENALQLGRALVGVKYPNIGELISKGSSLFNLIKLKRKKNKLREKKEDQSGLYESSGLKEIFEDDVKEYDFGGIRYDLKEEQIRNTSNIFKITSANKRSVYWERPEKFIQHNHGYFMIAFKDKKLLFESEMHAGHEAIHSSKEYRDKVKKADEVMILHTNSEGKDGIVYSRSNIMGILSNANR